jgi:asparagine synthase (glutamine-hydrolysing)
MCGISGIVRRDGQRVDRDVLQRMVRSLAHRGPDDEGLMVDGPVGLAMRRLAIIDLSPLGHQPMTNEDGQVELVFNGEIYNFEDLRLRLSALGHTFRGRSDTEVLVHGFEEYGAAGLARQLTGMFAIAILDRRTGQLHLVRDPLGIKPLYIRRTPRQLSFASELRALSEDGQGSLSAGDGWLGSYLRLGYVLSPGSAFSGVTKLEPGTILTIDLASGSESATTYYRLRPRPSPGASHEELLEQLNQLLGMTVRREMVADVEVGVFLSGGLDSGILAAKATRSSAQVRTFSMGFAGSDRGDETHAAAQVARSIGARNQTFRVEAGDLAGLDEIVASLEEPLADSAVLPLWELCKATSREVKVALSGEGGDEALGGYPRYLWGVVGDRLGSWPSGLAPSLRTLQGLLPPRSRGPLNLLRRVSKLADSAALSESDRYLAWFDLFTPAERRALAPDANDPAPERYGALFLEAHDAGLDPMQRMQFVDVHTMLRDNLLFKSDKLSMAHSLEVRVPMLNTQLVEFGLGLPVSAKLSPLGSKVLLRRLVQKEISFDAAWRKKRGFEIPVDHWFRQPAARALGDGLSTGPLVSGLGLAAPAIRSLVARHLGGEDIGRKLFALLMLEVWAKRNL